MHFGSGTLVRIDQKVASDDFNVQDRGRRWLDAAQIVIEAAVSLLKEQAEVENRNDAHAQSELQSKGKGTAE